MTQAILKMKQRSESTIEDEIIHWWKDDATELHRNALRLETERAQMVNGFPRDGTVLFRLINDTSQMSMKLSPDEALRIGTELLTLGKELINQKRNLWNRYEDE